MKIKYKEVNFREGSLQRINICNEIIGEYLKVGLRLTLRQLYYQLVTKNIIPNEEKAYKHLSSLISDARLAGLVDWNAIEDRIRRPKHANEFENLSELVEAALQAYRLPRWEGQGYYAELWVEKDALAGVLQPLAHEFHVTLMVNRGYSSQSAMYESSLRFRSKPRRPLLVYLGDLDPSGEDMVRDIYERMRMFGIDNIEVRKIALTMEQVKKYNPPPNPAKFKDPRSPKYVRQFGSSSWEVDALPPMVLDSIIRKTFRGIIDEKKMQVVIDREEKDKNMLKMLCRK